MSQKTLQQRVIDLEDKCFGDEGRVTHTEPAEYTEHTPPWTGVDNWNRCQWRREAKRQLGRAMHFEKWLGDKQSTISELRGQIETLQGQVRCLRNDANILNSRLENQKVSIDRYKSSRDRWRERSTSCGRTLRAREEYIEAQKDSLEAKDGMIRALRESTDNSVYVLLYKYRNHIQTQIAGIFTSTEEVDKQLLENPPSSGEQTELYEYELDKFEL